MTKLVATLAVTVAICCAALAPGAGARPTAQAAGCSSLAVGGKHFAFFKQGLSCKKARGLARLTYRTNKAPPGWKCPDASPGHNRRDGGQCNKPGTDKYFGYNLPD